MIANCTQNKANWSLQQHSLIIFKVLKFSNNGTNELAWARRIIHARSNIYIAITVKSGAQSKGFFKPGKNGHA